MIVLVLALISNTELPAGQHCTRESSRKAKHVAPYVAQSHSAINPPSIHYTSQDGGRIMSRSMRWLPWNGFARNGLQQTLWIPLYLVCPSTKQLYRAEWPLRLAESCNSNVASRATTWNIIRIMCIKRIIVKKIKFSIFNFQAGFYCCPRDSNSGQEADKTLNWPLD